MSFFISSIRRMNFLARCRLLSRLALFTLHRFYRDQYHFCMVYYLILGLVKLNFLSQWWTVSIPRTDSFPCFELMNFIACYQLQSCPSLFALHRDPAKTNIISMLLASLPTFDPGFPIHVSILYWKYLILTYAAWNVTFHALEREKLLSVLQGVESDSPCFGTQDFASVSIHSSLTPYL